MTVDSIKGSLREKGVRLTRQRQILLELIDQTGQHLDAERLFQLAQEKDPKLNRVTVYRTLKMLKAGGLVDELDLMHHSGDQHYYETRLKQEHAHVICLRCGKVEEFFGEPLQRLRKQIESHFGFQILLARTEVGGYCAHCQSLRALELDRSAPRQAHRVMDTATAEVAPSASVIVIDPSGHRSRVDLAPLPFKIGRQADNDLILRDSRASRVHARIVREGREYTIEDAGSRHGVYVNGKRVESHALRNSDRIEFGFPDSYQLIFAMEGAELNRLIDQFGAHEKSGPIGGAPGAGANLAKLRAILDGARTLQTGLSLQDVLNSVVDAALAITGAERGFLLLRTSGDLETRVARNRQGATLPASDLRVPRRVIKRALEQRRDLFSMNFDPQGTGEFQPERSVVDLELRSVISVPLVRIGKLRGDATNVLSTAEETAGVLYMDSRLDTADLAGGNRELLQTLAIEASTILENARLLEEERIKQKIEEELDVARTIQQSLRPRSLPADGWFRACGSSVASHQVGGDYYDVIPSGPQAWTAVVADVSGMV